MNVAELLHRLGIEAVNSGVFDGEWIASPSGGRLVSINPSTGEALASVEMAGRGDYDRIVDHARSAFDRWRLLPAPQRGQIVREIGDALRAHKEDLGALVSLEMGKILAEGQGEVQEMIDMADFAVGLSRQLYGLTMHSERPGHRMYEQWHPLGPVAVITAFNFPVAVWAWNALLAAVCGDTVIWKPSEQTPLTAMAVQKICDETLRRHHWPGVFNLAVGTGAEIGEAVLADPRIPLVSFTGSTRVGRRVAEVVGARLGRALLELGGNNGIIVMNDANLDLALRAIVFGAVGTAGQRCTSTRRIFVQRGVAAQLTEALVKAYGHVRIGDPLDPHVLMGPLISHDAVGRMMEALETIREQGGEILHGGRHINGCFVEPAIVRSKVTMPMVREEVFAPILHLIEFDRLEEAIAWHNAVPQGLSSAIFTANLIASEIFLSPAGSDCGIANVNIGTSGAEIGGAFGGEKDTGGGRESGSDAWKNYMRRQTNTINWSRELPLAQGIEFKL